MAKKRNTKNSKAAGTKSPNREWVSDDPEPPRGRGSSKVPATELSKVFGKKLTPSLRSRSMSPSKAGPPDTARKSISFLQAASASKGTGNPPKTPAKTSGILKGPKYKATPAQPSVPTKREATTGPTTPSQTSPAIPSAVPSQGDVDTGNVDTGKNPKVPKDPPTPAALTDVTGTPEVSVAPDNTALAIINNEQLLDKASDPPVGDGTPEDTFIEDDPPEDDHEDRVPETSPPKDVTSADVTPSGDDSPPPPEWGYLTALHQNDVDDGTDHLASYIREQLLSTGGTPPTPSVPKTKK